RTGAPPRAPATAALAAPAPKAAAPADRWPEPHASTRALTFAVDKMYPEARVRVLSVARRDPDALAGVYVRARAAYLAFLRQREPERTANPRPLNLVIVPAAFLRDAARFADATPQAASRYEARDATLLLADLPGFEREDLPPGIALHLCPVARD